MKTKQWREFELPGDADMSVLGHAVMDPFGALGGRRWQIETPFAMFCPAYWSHGTFGDDDPESVTIAEALGTMTGTAGEMIYDVGDGWVLKISIEDVRPAKTKEDLAPRYLGDKGGPGVLKALMKAKAAGEGIPEFYAAALEMRAMIPMIGGGRGI